MTLERLRRPEVLGPAGAIAAALVVHGMTLTSDFQDEDMRHLYESHKFEAEKYLVRPYGNHFCASFRLVTWLLHAVFGMNSFAFFAAMLLTHLLHVALLYGVIRALGRSVWIAALAAGLWGSAPAFQGSLQWYAAYSHLLGTTALLWPLWELARAASTQKPPTTGAIVRMSIAMFVGAGTELTGSLTAVMFPFVAVLLLPRPSAPLRTALWLLPAAALSIFVVLNFTGKANSQILWYFDWQAVITMFAGLVAYGVGMFVLAPFVTLSAEELTLPFHMSFAGALWMSAAVAVPILGVFVVGRLIKGDWAERRILLGLLSPALALYGAIAVGRSGLAFGHPLSWMATRDRYHYDASTALVAAIAISIAWTFPNVTWRLPRRWSAAVGGLGLAWLGVNTWEAKLTYLHGNGRQEWTRDWMDLVDGSLRILVARVPKNGILYVKNDVFRPATLIYAMGAPHSVLPGIGAYWITAHGVEPIEGRTIRFVEFEHDTLRNIRAKSKREVARMFVSPTEAVRAGGNVYPIQGNVPDDVAAYIAFSPDPMVGFNDHDLANRLRQTVRETLARPPQSWGPSESIVPGEPEEEPEEKVDEFKEDLRKAIENDPKAREEMRRAILADPKALEQVKRELQQQAEE
jgi:hypothetical protein